MNRIIFTVYQKDLTLEKNHENHTNMKKLLDEKGIPYSILVKHEKGVEELCLCITNTLWAAHESTLAMIKPLLREFNQKIFYETSGLSETCWRNDLSVIGRSEKYLGRLIECTKEWTNDEKFFLYNPVTKTYYVTETHI